MIVGHLQLYQTYNVHGARVDQLNFDTVSIRNYGTLTADSGLVKRTLTGNSIHVYPGGLITSPHLHLQMHQVLVDVMGAIRADGLGYSSDGESQRLMGLDTAVMVSHQG